MSCENSRAAVPFKALRRLWRISWKVKATCLPTAVCDVFVVPGTRLEVAAPRAKSLAKVVVVLCQVSSVSGVSVKDGFKLNGFNRFHIVF